MSGATALLLVDVQEDFLARPGLTPDRETFLASIAALLAEARSSGWRVVHVHTRVDSNLANAMPHRRNAAEVVAGTKGAQAPAEAAPADGEPTLFKRFFSAFDAEGLEEFLAAGGARRLVVAGTHTHACIRDTVSDAYRRGFEVVVPEEATASYDAAHGSLALGWMADRSAQVLPLAGLARTGPPVSWIHRDPRDQQEEMFAVNLTPPAKVHQRGESLAQSQPALAAMSLEARRDLLSNWQSKLAEGRERIRDSLVNDVAKPIRDADGELAYGMALVASVIATLGDEDAGDGRGVRYRPRGVVGLITPWNNPFAIAVGKIAPALGFGNAVLWKPALPATRIAGIIAETLLAAGLGDWAAMVPGGAGTGDALVADPAVAAVSFTGSVPVGRQLVARAATRRNPIPVQAELGGSNAAIIDSSADLDAAAADLAPAMFSFSGQRCTAIRRIIALKDIADSFTEKLVAEVEALRAGMPEDPECAIGPLINRASQSRIFEGCAAAVASGARLLCGGDVPASVSPNGCWVRPALIEGAGPDEPINQDEWFGPIGSIIRAADFDQAIELHNHSGFGLLGAVYCTDSARIEKFSRRAEAGILSIGQARPAFSAAGPFSGWKSSGFGIPEHGRWNRDFYCETQALYGA